MDYKYSILVNKQNPIPENFSKYIELKTVSGFDGSDCRIEKETYRAFLKLKDFLKDESIEIELDEAYRSVEEQKALRDSFTIRYGEDYAKTVVAEPGTSEHHTGLAVDIVVKKNDMYVTENEELLKLEKENDIIHACLSEFGFILRYPKGKEEITGYPYESWHFRYVGEEMAKEIYQKKLTLEEYYDVWNY